MAKRVEELLVYQKSLTALKAVSALVHRTGIGRDFKLRDRLIDAAIGVPRNISEGFGQQSDRLFAKYLYIGRGSAQEVRAHLAAAQVLGHLTGADLGTHDAQYEEIARMLTGLIRYLQACERRDRG